MEETQKCICCGTEKSINDFYAHPGMSNGHLGKCKECIKVYTQGHYKNNIAKHVLYERNREKDKNRKLSKLKYQQKRRKNNPQKAAAYNAVSKALMRGKIQRCPCEKCGDAKTQAHHEDYSRPLDVMWLCHDCHMKQHGKESRIAA